MIAALPAIGSVMSMLAPSGAAAAAAPAAVSAVQSGNGFGEVMAKVSSDAVQGLKGAESMAVEGIEGKADVQGVVQAVMSAQESLQTALAVRDKTVAAFQEITRMSI